MEQISANQLMQQDHNYYYYDEDRSQVDSSTQHGPTAAARSGTSADLSAAKLEPELNFTRHTQMIRLHAGAEAPR